MAGQLLVWKWLDHCNKLAQKGLSRYTHAQIFALGLLSLV
jgi:hypothetical protein